MKNLSPRDLSSIIGDRVDAVKDGDPAKRRANPTTCRLRSRLEPVFVRSPIGYSLIVDTNATRFENPATAKWG